MTSRQILNKSITRSGSQSIGERSFDYRNITNKPLEISGKGKGKVKGPDSKELKIFRPINKHKDPNSIRTLIPETTPIEPIKRSKSFLYSNKESTREAYTKPGHTLRKRSNNPGVYQGSFFFNDTCDDASFNQKSLMGYYNKKGRNNTLFKKYTNTTQILGLPGGEKRAGMDINDDQLSIRCDKGYTYSAKISKDFKSNIACLPGSGVNTHYEHNKMGLTYKYQSSDIFNVNPCSSTLSRYNYNSFKLPLGRRQIKQSNTESSSYHLTERPGLKCQGYKNISQVQLC